MKTLCFTLLLTLPAVAWSETDSAPPVQETASPPADVQQQSDSESDVTWMDESHAFATDQAQALTLWMDSFFGDPVYDVEKPESLLRLRWSNTWDQHDDYKSRLRLRGKVRLPLLSKRLNLVFSGDDGDGLPDDEVDSDDSASLEYKVTEGDISRFDLTLSATSDGVRPGVRYRVQGPISDRWTYRYTQRLLWESDEGFYTRGQFKLDHFLSPHQLLRWSSRADYGEETYGAEWRTLLSYNHLIPSTAEHDPFVIAPYVLVEGLTDPSYIRNYQIGTLFRRQVFRKYFFIELEPAYRFRKDHNDERFEDRKGGWNIVLRFEVLFETQRKRTRAGSTEVEPARVDNTAPGAVTDSLPQTPPVVNEQYR